MTAIRATFSDIRVVKGRKVVQLVMEIPIEEADSALRALGGVPQPDVSRWVGIAPLTEKAATRPAEAQEPVKKPKRRMSELSRGQQAGIYCSDPHFQKWIATGQPNNGDMADLDYAIMLVRQVCGVTSRTAFNTDEDAGRAWDALKNDFDAFTGRTAGPE